MDTPVPDLAAAETKFQQFNIEEDSIDEDSSAIKSVFAQHERELERSQSDKERPFRYGNGAQMSGWLKKKGGALGRKKDKFCALRSQTFSVASDRNTRPEHFYGLNGAKIEGDHGKLKIIITARNDPDPCQLYAETNEDYEKWMNALLGAVSVTFEQYYVLGDKLGSGAFGSVYMCKDKKTNEDLAVKVIERKNQNAREMDFIIRELRIMRTALHPNVVNTLDLFDTTKAIFIVMEYMPGGTLHDVLRDSGGHFTEEVTKLCMRDILRGIRYLHERRVVHRDIKLKNILVKNKTVPYHCVLADFGLSNFVGASTMSGHNLQSQVGSPHYVAPEVLSGEHYGPEVDLWSAGIVCYNMLTGKFPLAGRTVQETLRKVAKGEINWERVEHVSAEGQSFLKGLLEMDYKARLTPEQALKHTFIKSIKSTSITVIELDVTNESPTQDKEEKEF